MENILIRPCVLANKEDREIEREILDKLSVALGNEAVSGLDFQKILEVVNDR